MASSIIFAFDPTQDDYMLENQGKALARDYGSSFKMMNESISGKAIDRCIKMAESHRCSDIGFILPSHLLPTLENNLPQLYPHMEMAFIPSTSPFYAIREAGERSPATPVDILPKIGSIKFRYVSEKEKATDYLFTYILYLNPNTKDKLNKVLDNVGSNSKSKKQHITQFVNDLNSKEKKVSEINSSWFGLKNSYDVIGKLASDIQSNAVGFYEKNKEAIQNWMITLEPGYSGTAAVNDNGEAIFVIVPYNLPVKGSSQGLKDIVTVLNNKGNVLIPSTPYNNWQACVAQGSGAFLTPDFFENQIATVFGIQNLDKVNNINIQNTNYLYEFVQTHQRKYPQIKMVFYVPEYMVTHVISDSYMQYMIDLAEAGSIQLISPKINWVQPNAADFAKDPLHQTYNRLVMTTWEQSQAENSIKAAKLMGAIADRIISKKYDNNIWASQIAQWERMLASEEEHSKTPEDAKVAQHTYSQKTEQDQPKDQRSQTVDKSKDDKKAPKMDRKDKFEFDISKHGWIAAMVVVCIGEKTGKITMSGDKMKDSGAMALLKAFINPEDVKMAASLRDSMGLGILEDVGRIVKELAKQMDSAKQNLDKYNKLTEEQKQLFLIGGDVDFPKLLPFFDPIENPGVKA